MIKFRSLRFKLSLLYVLFLTLILSVFCSLLYLNVARTLENNTDENLLIQAESLSDALIFLWESRPDRFEKMSQKERELWVHQKLDGVFFRWRTEQKIIEDIQSVQLLDGQGNPLITSRRFKNLDLASNKKTIEQNKNLVTLYETFHQPAPIRLISLPVTEKKQLVYVLQVASSLKREEESLKGLLISFLFLVPGTLLISFLMGWIYAGRALMPIMKMVSQIKMFDPNTLDKRLDIHTADEELNSLTLTLNQMLDRLEEIFKRQRQFSAAASHELRTPLTAMQGEIEVSLRRTRSVAEYQRVLKAHLFSIQKLAALVEQLLLLARNKHSLIEKQKVSFDGLIRSSLDRLQHLIRKKKIKIHTQLPKAILLGEEKLLGALITNLLDNAIKHTPEKGSIFLILERRSKQWFLRIEDSGPGIAEDQRELIFDTFFKGQLDPHQNSNGIGLGLCRWIAEMHGGWIVLGRSVSSTGACFELFLPAPT